MPEFELTVGGHTYRQPLDVSACSGTCYGDRSELDVSTLVRYRTSLPHRGGIVLN